MKFENPLIIIRLGSHAEKEYVLKLATALDGIIVGANLFEATPAATASLLLNLKQLGCVPYIDPMTYAFGSYVDPNEGKMRTDLGWIKSTQKIKGKEILAFKKSYRRLAEAIGSIILDAVDGSKAVNPAEILSGTSAIDLCTNVIKYQMERIKLAFKEDRAYEDFIEDIPTPSIIFAPYFYMEPNQLEDWIAANLRLIEISRAQHKATPLHCILCADVSLLENKDALSRLCQRLIDSKIEGCWLWFSKFFEHDAKEELLQSYLDLVEKLSASMDVYSLHGGFFSLALFHHGLRGVSHGTGYGEQKDVVPIIGQSIPTVRYYLPSLRKRVGVPDIERCYDEMDIKTIKDFHEKVCDCVVCKGVVRNSLEDFKAFGTLHYSNPESKRMAQTPAAAKRCRFHFLIRRILEKNEVTKPDIESIRANLRNAYSSWGQHPVLKDSSLHLLRWAKVL